MSSDPKQPQETSVPVTLRDFFEKVYLKHRKLAPSSERNYRRQVRLIEKWWGSPMSVQEASPEVFRVWLRQAEYETSSMNCRYGLLASILNEAVRLGYRNGAKVPTALEDFIPDTSPAGDSPVWSWFCEWADTQETVDFTKSTYRLTLVWFERCLGRSAELEDLERGDLLEWFKESLQRHELAHSTVCQHVIRLRILKRSHCGDEPKAEVPRPDGNLWEFIEAYTLERGLQMASKKKLLVTVNQFEQWLERPAVITDMNRDTFNRWVEFMQQGQLAPRTIVGHRTDIVMLWRFAADIDLIEPPSRLRKVKKPRPRPRAWTLAELKQLLDACESEHEVLPTGVTRGQYMQALIRAGYDSGLRKSDLFEIKRSEIRQDGKIYMSQTKTGDSHLCKLRPKTLQLVLALPGEAPLRWPLKDSAFYRLWKRIRNRAGILNGGLHMVRRTGATYVAIDNPEHVTRFLGHRTASMREHYVDESIAGAEPLLPPDLDEDGEGGAK